MKSFGTAALVCAALSLFQGCSDDSNIMFGLEEDPNRGCKVAKFRDAWNQVLKPNCSSCHGASQIPLHSISDLDAAYENALPYLHRLGPQATNGHCLQSGCQLPGNSPDVQLLNELPSEIENCVGEAPEATHAPLSREILAKLLRKATLTSCDRLPTTIETRSILDAPNVSGALTAYKQIIDSVTTPECLKNPIFKFYRDLYEIGSDLGGSPGYAWNQAPLLATYIMIKDRDAREIVTADFCVNKEFEIETDPDKCTIHLDGPGNNPIVSGILTMSNLRYRYFGVFQLKFMNFVSSVLMGQPYPDTDAPTGLPLERLPQSPDCQDGSCPEQPVNFRSNCIQCHTHLNERVGILWNFDSRGRQTPYYRSIDPNGNTISTFEALQVDGPAVFKYYGDELSDIKDLGASLAKNKKYYQNAARTLMNFALGQETFTKKLPDELEEKYRKKLEENGGKLRLIYREFLKDEFYLDQRF